MKELTYEDWLKNPVPRNMWVWDGSERDKVIRKVIHFIENKDIFFPVVALSYDGTTTVNYKHCAEIEEVKTRRMTNKELARWLREHLSREYKYHSSGRYVYSYHTYDEINGDKEIDKDIVVREDYGEWKEPLVEVEE